MFDTHEKIVGILPTILGISSYSIFVWLGIFVGIGYYMFDANRKGATNRGGLLIIASALFFGIIGSKIPLMFESNNIAVIAYGKSIVGGLLGGMAGVFMIKKLFKIKLRMGNVIAPAVALGMSIGRMGCFLNGCCYGIKASWGFDFGDSCLRLPTQLFEVAFHFIAFILLHYYKNKVKTPGILFKIYVVAYFIFRFFIEFIRQNPKIWLNISIYQIICILGIMFILFKIWRDTSHE